MNNILLFILFFAGAGLFCTQISNVKKTILKTYFFSLTTNVLLLFLAAINHLSNVVNSWQPTADAIHNTIWLNSIKGLEISSTSAWVSSYFAILTIFITTIGIFGSLSIKQAYNKFVLLLIIIQLFLLISFYTSNLVIFYIFFEAILIPMFILITKWGPRNRKIKASFYLFIYTLLGSFFLLWAIYYIYLVTGSVNYDIVLNYTFSRNETNILGILLIVPFGVKIPMYPAHLWLPEAHVEAPTIGSVILASLLLKLGGYAFFKILLPIIGNNHSVIPLIYCSGLAGVIFGSLSTIRQIDLKKIIAYSSIAHMNLIVLGIFSANTQGLNGAIYLMVAHAFVSSGLFICIGVIYDRTHTRLIRYYGGLAQTMPVFSLMFFIFTLANMSFPGTSNFVGEMLILIGLYQNPHTLFNWLLLPLAGSGIVLSAVYSIVTYNKTIFGVIKKNYVWCYLDLTSSELVLLISLLTPTILFGIYSWSLI